jgi:hypothetical protein
VLKPPDASTHIKQLDYYHGIEPTTGNINITYANISVMGFDFIFGVIYYKFINILARSFAIDFGVIHNAFANISAKEFSIQLW